MCRTMTVDCPVTTLMVCSSVPSVVFAEVRKRIAPQVHSNDKCIGRDSGRSGSHYHADHSWEHGRITAGLGRSHVFRLAEGTGKVQWFLPSALPHTTMALAITGSGIQIRSRFIRTRTDGWWLARNVRLGTYVHVCIREEINSKTVASAKGGASDLRAEAGLREAVFWLFGLFTRNLCSITLCRDAAHTLLFYLAERLRVFS